MDVIDTNGFGKARVSVWEEFVNEMMENFSYCLKNFMI